MRLIKYQSISRIYSHSLPTASLSRTVCWWVLASLFTMTLSRPVNELRSTTEREPAHEPLAPSSLSEEDGSNTNPKEIQKAVCTVTAGDVKASAEAFSTKELKGVCAASKMESSFAQLEGKLMHQFALIKEQLLAISQRDFCTTDSNMQAVMKPRSSVAFKPIPADSKRNNNVFVANEKTAHQIPLAVDNDFPPIVAPRGVEAKLPIENGKTFTYFWKIEHFKSKIENGTNIVQESPVFSIRGKVFRIKASFQHLRRDFLYLKLEAAAYVSSSRNNIILETGGLFKEINSNVFKYKITVLHQKEESRKDLESQEFDNFEGGFLIPNSALLDSPFVKDDTILIQIVLYL